MDDIIGSTEAGRILATSPEYVAILAREGRLVPVSVSPGGHRRFRRADVLALAEQRLLAAEAAVAAARAALDRARQ